MGGSRNDVGGSRNDGECRDGGECGDDVECGDAGAYRNGAGDMQFFPWERQSPHWHTSGS